MFVQLLKAYGLTEEQSRFVFASIGRCGSTIESTQSVFVVFSNQCLCSLISKELCGVVYLYLPTFACMCKV